MMTMLDAWLVHAAGRAECTSVLCNKFAAARDARGCATACFCAPRVAAKRCACRTRACVMMRRRALWGRRRASAMF